METFGTSGRRGRDRARAMSLVELLIAVLILGGVLVGLFQGIHVGYQGTERLIEESYASNHAISLLEALTCLPYSRLPEIKDPLEDTAVREKMKTTPGFVFPGAPDPEMKRTVEIEEVSKRTEDPGDGANSQWGSLKRVRVVVRWQCRYLRPRPWRTLVFQSLVTDDTEVSK